MNWFVVLEAVVVAFALGFCLGGRQEAWYWADHGDKGGSVHHKGKFYVVKPEGSSHDPHETD